MSEIKTLDGLRDWVSHIDENPHLGELTDTGKFGLRNIADAIQAEVDERFIELPVDADGVPILLDDVVEPDGDEPFEVRALMLDASGWFVIERLGSNWAAKQVHHVKPRTLEDALADMANNIAMQVDGRIHHWKASDFGDEAAEIRELLGVDA